MPVDPAILSRLGELEAENRWLRDALRDANTRFQAISRAVQGATYEVGPVDYSPTARDEELRGVRRLNALKARCFVAKLSDVQRRAALDKAHEAGAIDEGFDETELPWRSEELALDPTVDPVRAATVSGAAGALGELGATEHAFWLMSRLARLSPEWSAMRREVFRGWDGLRARGGDDEERFDWPGRYLFAAGPGRADYPSGLSAVRYDDFRLPGGSLRSFGRWQVPYLGTRLDGQTVWNESEELGESALMAEAKACDGRYVRVAMTRLSRCGAAVQALALMEVVLGVAGTGTRATKRGRRR